MKFVVIIDVPLSFDQILAYLFIISKVSSFISSAFFRTVAANATDIAKQTIYLVPIVSTLVMILLILFLLLAEPPEFLE